MNTLTDYTTDYIEYCKCRKHLNPKTLKAYNLLVRYLAITYLYFAPRVTLFEI